MMFLKQGRFYSGNVVHMYVSDTSFVSYFISEVTHGYQLKQDKHLYSEKQRRITTFMKTPRELEKVSRD